MQNVILPVLLAVALTAAAGWAQPTHAQPTQLSASDQPNAESVQQSFQKQLQPLLKKYCLRCHNAEKMESGIRLDQLDGSVPDERIRHWKNIQSQVDDEAMPPEDEAQPTPEERASIVKWIDGGILFARSRVVPKNGSARRLTVVQYRNTLQDLLGIDDDLTDALPPDSVSKDGFVNNGQTMLLSPLLLEGYFNIAEQALDLSIVDESEKPVVQFMRMELGADINSTPFPESLILGANSHLLANQDFVVTQPRPEKPFQYTPLEIQTKYRFHEGYQGNSTVRGWRDYDSIYHAVFACMRGNPGYPKGLAFETVPAGLLLRPAIPSAELFGVESTYGPKANFKISLRELPEHGRFRVTIKAAKYDDALLLDPGTDTPRPIGEASLDAELDGETASLEVPEAGIYQVDVYLNSSQPKPREPDDSKLAEGLVGSWSLDDEVRSGETETALVGQLVGDAKFTDSPFGKAVSLAGDSGAVVVPRENAMNVGEGEFTVAAWIRPTQLRQAGIVCLGGYGYTHGWLLDMPDGKGVLRIETAKPDGANGTVQSRPGVIRVNQWQHVAVVVRRGDSKTRLYVNGYEVGSGIIGSANLDNPKVDLHIGRVQEANLFKGDIDEVRIYRRALDVSEVSALVAPGRPFAQAPPSEKPHNLRLNLGQRNFSGLLRQPAFLAVRLPKGPLDVRAVYDGASIVKRLTFTRLEPSDPIASRFAQFEERSPGVGVHVGLRRDCGSTLTRVGSVKQVSNTELDDYVFVDAISNYPSPDVQKENDNYLAGVREIGVRSEFTDGRDAPRLIIRSVEFEGPYYESWPPASHRSIFIPSPNRSDPEAYARDIIESFAKRAYRRPANPAELETLMAVWTESFKSSHNFTQSIKDALIVVLTSPQFLFLIENSAGPQPEAIDEWELASKLSYFLWNTPPDERLLKLAQGGNLHRQLSSETTRMIRDARFRKFTNEFAAQWLSLDKFDVVEIDRKKFPTLTRDTRTQLRREPVEFLNYLIEENLPVKNLVRSDFILANEVVASYYGLATQTESGFQFTPVRHGDKHLGGLLTQSAILAGLSNGRESNPVKRGAWLARKIIAEPPDDPPPNVPALEEDTTHLPLRERLKRHRNQPGCVKCHEGIDPWGVPFEEFDAGGLRKRGEVDARSTLPDDTEVAGLIALKDYLAEDRVDQVAFSFLKHLSAYAVGRSLTYNESRMLKEESVELKADGYRMQDMIRFVVTSEIFLEK